MELKKRAERKTDRELYMGIFEGCMEKTADIVRAAAMAEQIQLFSYYDKEEKLVFFQKKIETEGHSPRGMHGYLDSLKEKIRSFDREKTEQELHGIFGPVSYTHLDVYKRQGYTIQKTFHFNSHIAVLKRNKCRFECEWAAVFVSQFFADFSGTSCINLVWQMSGKHKTRSNGCLLYTSRCV